MAADGVAVMDASTPGQLSLLFSSAHRRAALWLALAVFVPAMLVYHPLTGWNVNTRLALVFAVVDQGTFIIDDYHLAYETGDKAFFDGHFYSDKIIGLGLLALPFYWVWRQLGFPHDFEWADYLLRMWSVTIPACVAIVLFWRLMIHLGGEPRRALVLTALAFFGSMLFGYSTIFMPYVLGIACLLGALLLLARDYCTPLTMGQSALIGFLCGYAMLSDFLFGLSAIGVGIIFLARAMGAEGATPSQAARNTLIAGIAAAVPVALFVAYSISIYGEPTIPYQYEDNVRFREGMAQGLMGATHPNPAAIWFLTVHPYRSVFFWYPWIIGGMAGLVMLMKTRGYPRLLGGIGLLCVAGYFYYNISYYMWWGGWSMGPRLLIPAGMFVVLGLAPLTRATAPRWVFIAMVVLGVVAVLLNHPLGVMEPQIPQGNADELMENATWRSRLDVPQFVFLRIFYTLDIFRTADGTGWVWNQMARRLLAFVSPAVFVGLGWWELGRTKASDNSDGRDDRDMQE
jgi:hypothetical protein